MAKKKNDDGGWLSFIVVAALFAAPIIAAMIYFDSTSKYRKALRSVENGTLKFTHSVEEVNEMIYHCRQIFYHREAIENALEKGNDLNLTVNLDGSFSRRSKAGKEIDSVLSESRPSLYRHEGKLSIIKNRPSQDWEELNESMRSAAAAKLGLITWLASCLFFYIVIVGREGRNFLMAYGIASVICLIFSTLSFLTNSTPADKISQRPRS